MPMKKYKPEQIVTLSRQIEVEFAVRGRPPLKPRDSGGVVPFSRA
jgi:hypothetical protein